MGDHAWTRFLIPLAAIQTPSHRAGIAASFSMASSDLDALLDQQLPVESVPEFRIGNTGICRVHDIPCLAVVDDDCNYGGEFIADALVELDIPFRLFNRAGDEYGPGLTAYAGKGERLGIACNDEGFPIVRVEMRNGRAVVGQADLRYIMRFDNVSRQALGLPAIHATKPRQAKRRPRPPR